MKLTKERARSPLIEDAPVLAGLGFNSTAKEMEFTLSCNGPWVQGKGHITGYTVHLNKMEALYVIKTWLSEIESDERRKSKTDVRKLLNQ